jgi:transcriptional regulator with XRE-family HTH domain
MTEHEFLVSMGKNISRFRKLKGMSQLDLCAIIEMEKSNLSAIENGRQNATTLTLKKICDALEIEVSYLFNFESENQFR